MTGGVQTISTMDIRKEIERKIDKKREEIATLTRTLGEARAYLQALEDTRKMLPKDVELGEEFVLRANTDLASVRDILRKEGKPLHVDELLKRLGKPNEKKVSLSGSLSVYVRDRKIFTRPAPNTFGLIEFEQEEFNGDPEPPENFGMAEGNGLASK